MSRDYRPPTRPSRKKVPDTFCALTPFSPFSAQGRVRQSLFRRGRRDRLQSGLALLDGAPEAPAARDDGRFVVSRVPGLAGYEKDVSLLGADHNADLGA